MSKDKFINQTLTLPSELPLFNYNINFEGLRHILEDVNVKTNLNEELIKELQQQVNNKLPTQYVHLIPLSIARPRGNLAVLTSLESSARATLTKLKRRSSRLIRQRSRIWGKWTSSVGE